MSHTDRKERADEVIAMLAARWPACFSVWEGRRKPLQLKIHLDILAAAPDIPASDLALALRIYTANVVYLKGCREGADRIALDGSVAGHVTAAEAVSAAASLAGRLAARRKRRIAGEWEAAWERRTASRPSPQPADRAPEPDIKPEPAETLRVELPPAPVRRGDGFNALREAARARAAKKAEVTINN